MTKNASACIEKNGEDRGSKDFNILKAHLKKAHQSNELATSMYQKGFAKDAQQQSLLTKVFICNALHHVSQRCKSLDP